MKKGYTLIELLVVISIFTIFISSVSGIFIFSLKTQRRVLAERELIDQTSYVLEYMGRALRMAKKDDEEEKKCLSEKRNYEVTPDHQSIKFRNYKDECQRFYLEDGQLKEERDGKIFSLTSEDLRITKIEFYLIGDEPNDNLQPRVTISLKIMKKDHPETEFTIQTTVSQRNLDVES
jgi:prepilin-type N-terminal cleavage/methylation domain-containing protein